MGPDSAGQSPRFGSRRRGGAWDPTSRGGAGRRGSFRARWGRTAEAFWEATASSGFLEYRAFKNIDVIQGVGVGGARCTISTSTCAGAGIDRWPAPLGRTQLDPYYALVEDHLGPRPLAPPALRVGCTSRAPTRSWPPRERRAAIRAPGADRRLHRSRADEPGRRSPVRLRLLRQLHARVPRSRQEHPGPDVHRGGGTQARRRGLPAAQGRRHPPGDGARRTPGRLPRADRRIAPRPSTRARSTPPRWWWPPERWGRPSCCCAAATSCARCHAWRRGRNALLGERQSAVRGGVGKPRPIDSAAGPSITAMVDVSTPEHAIHIQIFSCHPMLWFVEGALPSGARANLTALKLAARYVGRFAGDRRRAEPHHRRNGQPARQRANEPLLAVPGDGDRRGRRQAPPARRRAGRGLEKGTRGSRQMFRQMEDALRRISREAGGTYMTSFLWRWPFRKLMTAHPLGGCVLGTDPSTSAVDRAGEVSNSGPLRHGRRVDSVGAVGESLADDRRGGRTCRVLDAARTREHAAARIRTSASSGA